MKTSGTCILLCLLVLSLSPADWFPWVVNGQDLESATGDVTSGSLLSSPGHQFHSLSSAPTLVISWPEHLLWLKLAWDNTGRENWNHNIAYTGCVIFLNGMGAAAVTPPVVLPSAQSDSETATASSDCREEKFPCTRLYSVHKPVKQCISYLCVTSVRRMYIINKEVCSRIVCKENEVMQDEICRQLAGLPPRRLRRSGQPLPLPCRELLEKQHGRLDAL